MAGMEKDTSMMATVTQEDVQWLWSRFNGGQWEDDEALWTALKERSDQMGHRKGALSRVSLKVIGLFVGVAILTAGMGAFIALCMSMRNAPAAITLTFVLLAGHVALGLFFRFRKEQRLHYAGMCFFVASLVFFSLGPEFVVLNLVGFSIAGPICWPLANAALVVGAFLLCRAPLLTLLFYVYFEMFIFASLSWHVSVATLQGADLAMGAVLLVLGWILDRWDHEDYARWPIGLGLVNVCGALSLFFWGQAWSAFVLPVCAILFVVCGWLMGYIMFHFAAAWAVAFWIGVFARTLTGMTLAIALVVIGVVVVGATLLLAHYQESIAGALARKLPAWAFTRRMRRRLGYDTLQERRPQLHIQEEENDGEQPSLIVVEE